MIQFRLLVLFALCWPVLAADTALSALRSTLVRMREKQPEHSGPRGATPELTVAKHQLRDWVESRLPALPQRGDEREFERKLNAELRKAKLVCDEEGRDREPCNLGDLTLRRSTGFLIVQTGIDIECGADESAYIYSWSQNGWRRSLQTEQNTYTKAAYKPQTIHSVLIASGNGAGEYLAGCGKKQIPL